MDSPYDSTLQSSPRPAKESEKKLMTSEYITMIVLGAVAVAAVSGFVAWIVRRDDGTKQKRNEPKNKKEKRAIP